MLVKDNPDKKNGFKCVHIIKSTLSEYWRDYSALYIDIVKPLLFKNYLKS